ncbi:MAG: lytic murein transglycosylase B [Myxococcota bacterium]
MIALLCLLVAHGASLDPKFVGEVAKTAEQPTTEVEAQLATLERDESVLERLATPWEAKPWHEYGPLFLTEDRIDGGRAFLAKHEDLFIRAERTYGVPREVVCAILGVETSYGGNMGADSIATALFTLGFFHERRGPFFRKELGHFLFLAKREGWTLTDPKGSYAGAMGMGQFIPSSYLDYAVDFDEDGKTDLFGSPADAIGSVARYLALHGWLKGEPILIGAQRAPKAAAKVRKGLKLDTTVGALLRSGVTLDQDADPHARAKLFAFEMPEGVEYRVGLRNFYVITRYNRSTLYARAVTELAAAY